MTNNFTNAPTVGSHDYHPSIEELHSRIDQLESRLNEVQNQRSSIRDERPRKIKWKKIKKVFNGFIKPVLDFIPKFLNAICRFREMAPAR